MHENRQSGRAAREHGPVAVDSSLREVAALLAGGFRGTDIVARLGESQFAALAVDAAEPSAPVLCQRLEKRIAMLNRDRGPWGPFELRMSARSWSPKEAMAFSEFLDSVEAGLRLPAIPFIKETASPRKAMLLRKMNQAVRFRRRVVLQFGVHSLAVNLMPRSKAFTPANPRGLNEIRHARRIGTLRPWRRCMCSSWPTREMTSS